MRILLRSSQRTPCVLQRAFYRVIRQLRKGHTRCNGVVRDVRISIVSFCTSLAEDGGGETPCALLLSSYGVATVSTKDTAADMTAVPWSSQPIETGVDASSDDFKEPWCGSIWGEWPARYAARWRGL